MTKGVKHLNVQVEAELYEELQGLVPWGLRTHLMDSVLRLIRDVIVQEGPIMLGAIMAGHYKLVLNRMPVQNVNADRGGDSGST